MATFQLIGDRAGQSTADVTDHLQLSPTRSHEIGDPVGGRTAKLTDHARWSLSSGESPEDDVELSEQLRRVLDLLEPRRLALWELAAADWEAQWFCYIGSRDLEHAVLLDRPLMQRLLALPGCLLLDIYGEGDEDQ